MYEEQPFVVTCDKFIFARPELGKPGEGVSVRHDQVWRRSGKKFHEFRMPRANAPRLSEKQHIRMTIDASQFAFDRRKGIKSCDNEFEIGKFVEARRKRCK